MMYVQFDDVAFVTGDHLERFPLVPKVLEKLGAIVIDNCGGPEARKDLAASFARAAEDKRIVLIYPEGHLAKVGEHHRYRAHQALEPNRWPVSGRHQPRPALAAGGLSEIPWPADHFSIPLCRSCKDEFSRAWSKRSRPAPAG
jgi:hypothetical protein